VYASGLGVSYGLSHFEGDLDAIFASIVLLDLEDGFGCFWVLFGLVEGRD
jgi:hypothetical protein